MDSAWTPMGRGRTRAGCGERGSDASWGVPWVEEVTMAGASSSPSEQ